MRRVIGWTAAGVAAVVVVALLVGAFAARPAEAAYVTAPAARGTITQQVALAGTIEREGQASVGFDNDGLVSALHVRVGDEVVAGQQIASIDPAPLRLAVLQARASLTQAEAQLDADLSAQDAGSASLPAGVGGLPAAGALPTGAAAAPTASTPPTTAPAAGLPTAGLPGVPAGGASGVPTAGLPGVPAGGASTAAPVPGGSTAAVTELTDSLAALQQVVLTQQAVCQPVFAAAAQLGTLVQGVTGGLPSAVPTSLPTSLPASLPSPLPTGPATPVAGATHTARTPTPAATPTGSGVDSAAPSPDAGPPAATATPGTPAGTATPGADAATPDGAPASPRADAAASPHPDRGHPRPSAHPTALPTALPSLLPTGLPTALPGNLPTSLPSSLPLDQLPALLGQVQACSQAMVALATAEGRAGAAILAASQALAAANEQAAASLAAAQQQMQAAAEEAARQAAQQASEAARKAAEEAFAQAQADLAAQLASQYGGRVTDATIATDRARVLAARQQLDSAEANLAGATVISPIAGTVGAMTFVAGESSAGRDAVVVGDGAATLTVEVPLSSRPLVASGTIGTASPVAAGLALPARVAGVSELPTTTGNPTYRATVHVDDPGQALASGSRAEVTLSLRAADDVLSVPMSAVTRITDTTGTVEVVDNARATQARPVTVVTGSQGGGRIEVVSGLSDGDLVVLADRRLPVPGGIDQYANLQRGGRSTPTPTPSR